METLYQILGLIATIGLIWFLYRTVKSRPEQFSREHISNSLRSMGLLALILMVFVAFLIYIVRHS